MVQIVGAGPAGSMAALAAMREGSAVRIFEKSAFPRHKVCGEFLSPAVPTLLRRVDCEAEFFKWGPAAIHEMRLHFGAAVVRHRLPEPAYGLSRYALDRLLLERAVTLGATVVRKQYNTAAETALECPAVIVSSGRKSIAPASTDRLFGFKAHFSGPVNDAVELFFFDNCYVGVSAIENGETNVCGLAPEKTLRACGFHPAELLNRCAPLAERVRPLARVMEWLVTGPLVFSNGPEVAGRNAPPFYPAGDALAFIDPFTGSGILNAMLTGELAGRAAAQGAPVEKYLRECRRLLRRPFLVSHALRALLASGHADVLAPLVPGRLLLYATRPVSLKAA